MVLLAAVPADEPAHVLDETEGRDVEAPEHLQRLNGDAKGGILRRAHDRDAGERHRLRQRERRVAGPRRQVDDEIVELTPSDVGEHLLDPAGHHGSAPHQGLLGAGQKSDRHEAHAVRLERDQLLVQDFGLIADAEHARHRRTVDVGVEQSDTRPLRAQRDREIDRHRRLADAALARPDRQNVLDPRDGTLARLASEGRLHVGGHAHIHGGDPGQTSDQVACHRAEPVAHRTGRRGQLKRECDSPLIADGEVLDHAQADDVAMEVRVLDRTQGRQDLFRLRRLDARRATGH